MFQRLFFSAFVLTAMAGSLSAQISAYSFSQSAGSYTPITGGTTFTMVDDALYTATIPSFTYNGATYTSLTISTNGFISLGTLVYFDDDYDPISLGITGTGGAIAPFGRDLTTANSGTPEIRLEQVGNEVVVQWQDVRCYYSSSNSERLSFQARLNTTNGVIQVVYGGTIVPATNTTYPQVGLRGSSNTDYNNRSVVAATGAWVNSVAGTANSSTCYFNSANSATVPSVGTTFQWTPPSCFAPSGLTAAVQNGTTVNFSWATAVANGQIVVVPQGSAASVGTPSAISGTSISVSSLTGGTAYTAYVRAICGTGDTSAWSTGVNFTPTCANTTGLAASNILTNSANFTWTTALASGQIVVVPQGSAASVGTPSAVSGTSATMSSLVPATAYSVYIRRICGAGDTSSWSSAVSFTTACPAFSTPWSDNLETIPVTATGTQTLGAVAPCWSRTGDVYGANAPFTTYNRAPRSGSKFMTIAYGTTTGTGDYAYTPGLSLLAGQEYAFSFWYQTDGRTGWDTLRAAVGTSTSAASMTRIGTPVYAITNTSYTQMTASYTPSSNGTYYFGVNLWATSSPWYVSFDDFNVAPVCPAAPSLSKTDITCVGAANGTASVSVAGPSYSFVWGDGQTAAARTGLAAGTYNVTASNPAGCSISGAITITEPTAITATISSQTDVSCNGGADAIAVATGNGGTGTLSYNWSNGVNTATNNSLTAGVHSLTISDANNCTAVAATTIAEPSAVSVSVVSTDLSCANSADGTATAIANGGVSVFVYLWSNNNTSGNISGLAAGVYTATATDANGCAATAATTITEPAAISISATASQVSCNGGNDGQATATANGGAGSLSLLWSNNANTNTISGLAAGVYTATATDANNCAASVSTTITEPSAINISAATTQISCNGSNDGQATATANGGTGSLSFVWSNSANTNTISGLAPGVYTATATDANNCAAVVTSTIAEPSAITNSTTSTLASCETCADGTASITANGGTGAFTFLWSDGQTTSTATGLLTGNYTATITDANGCSSNASVAVSFVVGVSQNQTASSLRLFPNPTSSIVTLEGLSNEAQISIINALGQTIRSFQTQDNTLQIDLSDLPEATYFIRVQSSNSQQTLPVVRTR